MIQRGPSLGEAGKAECPLQHRDGVHVEGDLGSARAAGVGAEGTGGGVEGAAVRGLDEELPATLALKMSQRAFCWAEDLEAGRAGSRRGRRTRSVRRFVPARSAGTRRARVGCGVRALAARRGGRRHSRGRLCHTGRAAARVRTWSGQPRTPQAIQESLKGGAEGDFLRGSHPPLRVARGPRETSFSGCFACSRRT